MGWFWGVARARVAELDQVSHGCVDASGIIQQDGADLRVFEMELAEHDGHVVNLELVEHRLFTAESQDRDAFHLALEHSADAVGELLGIAVRGTN